MGVGAGLRRGRRLVLDTLVFFKKKTNGHDREQENKETMPRDTRKKLNYNRGRLNKRGVEGYKSCQIPRSIR